MKFTREVKTGILAVCAIALLIFGYSFLKGKNLFENNRTLYAIYDNVEGLIPSSPVTINGLVVGKVVAIDFFDASGKLIVKFSVNNDFKFSKNSLAKISGSGLIGGKSLAIIPTYQQGLEAKNKDTLNGKVEGGIIDLMTSKLTPLQQKIELAVMNADSLLVSINKVLSEDTQNNINTIFSDLSTTVRNFKQASGSLNAMLSGNEQKLNNTFTNLDQMSTNLNKFSGSLSQVDAAKLSRELEAVLANFNKISSDINAGKGTVGKLLKDKKLYTNLEQASKQLETLLEDLRLNPKRYVHISVFGKKNTPYVKPTDSIQ
ncbi:MCE family protein [Aquimarina sp. TRL1]|uniref:MlaD family protein n=1 Tax=Aquimarina sp. (strain TRL1) TaxID=2736252 RepID=UPI00158E8A01|nr:MlaD family protein [Aquimarina sp. TRL1]QKX06997.1 MCE family protein [Aquimarina sp. TRL1]